MVGGSGGWRCRWVSSRRRGQQNAPLLFPPMVGFTRKHLKQGSPVEADNFFLRPFFYVLSWPRSLKSGSKDTRGDSGFY